MNIEAISRAAGFHVGEQFVPGADVDTLSRFAALVLEQAAQTTDDGSIEGCIFAQAIRAMKPTRPMTGPERVRSMNELG